MAVLWIVSPVSAEPKRELPARVAVPNGTALVSGVTVADAHDLAFRLLMACETLDPDRVRVFSKEVVIRIAKGLHLARVKRDHDRGVDVTSAPTFEDLSDEDRNAYLDHVHGVIVELAKLGVFVQTVE